MPSPAAFESPALDTAWRPPQMSIPGHPRHSLGIAFPHRQAAIACRSPGKIRPAAWYLTRCWARSSAVSSDTELNGGGVFGSLRGARSRARRGTPCFACRRHRPRSRSRLLARGRHSLVDRVEYFLLVEDRIPVLDPTDDAIEDPTPHGVVDEPGEVALLAAGASEKGTDRPVRFFGDGQVPSGPRAFFTHGHILCVRQAPPGPLPRGSARQRTNPGRMSTVSKGRLPRSTRCSLSGRNARALRDSRAPGNASSAREISRRNGPERTV